MKTGFPIIDNLREVDTLIETGNLLGAYRLLRDTIPLMSPISQDNAIRRERIRLARLAFEIADKAVHFLESVTT